MSQKHFFVSHAGNQEGPISLDEIVSRIHEKTLEVSDYLYDEAQQDWVMLMAYPALAEKVKSFKPEASSAPAPSSHSSRAGTDHEWYVLKGDSKFGPFSHREVVRMLQDKSVFEYDYVWHAKLSGWERVASLPDFSPEAIRDLRTTAKDVLHEIFFRRRHARVPLGASLLVHNYHRVFKAKSLEVSAGGAGLVIDHGDLQPGDKLFLHFKPSEDVPPFHAQCEVVSKRLTDASDKTAPVQYGVKFTQLEQHAQEVLNEVTTKRTAA